METQTISVYQRLVNLGYRRLEEMDIQVLQGRPLDREQRKLYRRIVKFMPKSPSEVQEKNIKFISSLDAKVGA